MSNDELVKAAQQKVRDQRAQINKADPATLDLLFRDARSHYGWQPRGVDDDLLKSIYELAKWGPTSMNQQPVRFLFVRSPEAKAKLLPALGPSNQPKMMAAPVTAIIAHDLRFFDKLPEVFPPNPKANEIFASNQALAEGNAVRNGTLQAAYFMIAARALGLDVGPMSGFDAGMVDREFLAATSWKTNFLCNLGYGDEARLFQRLPRLSFDDVAKVI
jgi:3-hydroxypropanoate dehydrogenase